MSLKDIRKILTGEDFDELSALQSHLSALLERREQLNLLISNLEKTINAKKGEIFMSDKEKFEGFVKKLVEENEEKYGMEAREKYGDEAVDRSNAKLLNLSPEKYAEFES